MLRFMLARFMFTIVLQLGMLCPLYAQNTPAKPAPDPANPTLTLGPEVLTLPEITQKLSVGGHKVTCAPALQQFAAFVSLKNRPWDKMCRLLEQGLQVQFSALKDAPANREMRWDSSVRQRERGWLTRFADNLHQYLQERINIRAGYVNMPTDAFRLQFETMSMEMRALEAKKDFDYKSPRYQQLSRLYDDMDGGRVLQADGVDELLAFTLAQRSIPSPVDVQDLIRRGYSFRIEPPNRVPDTLLDPVLARHSDPKTALPPHFENLITGWSLDNSSGHMLLTPYAQLQNFTRIGAISLMANGACIPYGETSLAQYIFQGVLEGDQHRFEGLGKPAAQWLQSQQKQTQAALADARMRYVVPRQGLGGFETSYLIEMWSRTRDVEAVMVLWPQRETELLPARIDKAPPTGLTPASLFDTPNGWWAVHKTDDVFLIQNLLAFVDRERVLPVAALVQYARIAPTADQYEKSEQAVMPYGALQSEKLRDYCKAAANAPLPFFSYPLQISNYRNMNVQMLDENIGAMFLWERLPAGRRASLLQEARKAAPDHHVGPSVLLSEFDQRDREKLVQILRAWGVKIPQAILPSFEEALRTYTLYIEVRPVGKGTAYRVDLSVRAPQGSEAEISTCNANFLWQP